MKKLVVAVCGVLAVSLAFPTVAAAESPKAKKTTLKLGTLAPRSSSWMAVFVRAAAEIKKATDGQVVFKIYPGGRQGDEKVMVGKMRTGQLDAAAVTAVGLGEILPEVLVLQAPRVLKSYKQLDKVRGQLQPEWDKKMLDKGFILMGWGDVGSVDWHSKHSIATPDDIKKGKVWIWNADPVARATAKALNITGVPASVPDVLAGLNSGNMDTMFASPLACLQLAWCDHMKARTDRVWSFGIGALLLSKKGLEKVPEPYRATVQEIWAKWTKALVKKIRVDNDKARKILAAKKGVAPVSVSDTAAWDKLAKSVQNELVKKKIFTSELLGRVKSLAK